MSEKLAVDPVQRDEVEWTAVTRELLLAAGVVVTFTARPVFLSGEQAGEPTGVSRGTVIGPIGAGEIVAVAVGTNRDIPLGAFGANRRGLLQWWRWQRCPRR